LARERLVLCVDIIAFMPSERIQQLIDSLLDEAAASVSSGEWSAVAEKAQAVLAIAPDNQDAQDLQSMAQVNGATEAVGARAVPRTLEPPSAVEPATAESEAISYESERRPRPDSDRQRDHRRASEAADAKVRNTASFGARVGAYLIDAVLFVAAGVITALLADSVAGDGGSTDEDVIELAQAALIATIFVLAWLLNASGVSPGKALFGIRIVRANGRSPGAEVGLGRTVAAVVSGAFFGLGYLWAAWHPQTRTWHDSLTGTWVVRKTGGKATRAHARTVAHRGRKRRGGRSLGWTDKVSLVLVALALFVALAGIIDRVSQ
jgi:uncharacterized RDD family membrane protein YckC